MVSIPYKMSSGIAGQITRGGMVSTVEDALIDPSTNTPTAYGVPLKYSTDGKGRLQAFGTGDSASKFVGILVRPFVALGGATNDPLGTSTPNLTRTANLIKSGYIAVQAYNYNSVKPTKGSPVYVRVASASANTNPALAKVIGGFETASDVAATGVAGTNTGNGTIGTLSATQATAVGTYTAIFTAATKYNVTDASGAILGAGTTGTALTLDNGLAFTITAGLTAFVANDTFVITVADNNVLITPAYYTGGLDANGIAEIAYNI